MDLIRTRTFEFQFMLLSPQLVTRAFHFTISPKDPFEDKYQFLINKRESIEFKHCDDPKAFIKYSNDIQDVYKNINEYNTDKKRF